MDRFEVRYNALKKMLAKIYIPVWIDLKALLVGSYIDAHFDLHSSMDRFEADDAPGGVHTIHAFTFQYG